MTDVLKPLTQIDETYEAMRAFREKLNELTGEEILVAVCRDFACGKLEDSVRRELILQLLTAKAGGPNEFGLEVKQDAVHLAEMLGPEWCQWLYRFAVLCTKLA